VNNKPEPDHDCYDYSIEVPCWNPECDDGHVVVVNATTGDVVFDGECEECDGWGFVWECIVCSRLLY
jgi:hypothetical protein